MRVSAVLGLALFLALSGCENYDLDLHDQVSYKIQEYPRFRPPENSVTVVGDRIDYENEDGALLINPHRGVKGMLERGKGLYNTYCIPCHGPDGTTNNTPVAEKFDPRPANLMGPAVLELTEGEIFQRVMYGTGVMPGYKTDLSDEEAWEVTAYVLKLQKRE